MNILFISRAYGKNAGGMERLSFELIHSFPDAQSIVHNTPSGKPLLYTRMRSVVFAMTVLPKALMASKNADIVHIGDPLLSFVGWCIMQIRHIPVVVTVHGLDVTYTHPLYRAYLKIFFTSLTHYVAISTYAAQLLRKHNINTERISVIPPGIIDDIYSNRYTRNDLGRLIYRNVTNRIVFVTTGRLIARKGHAWFIQSVMPKLPRTALYVIAGDGPKKHAISACIKSLKLEDRVVMLGRVSDEEKKILLNTCDVFIQPNIPVEADAEGFGIAPIEAALCGRTVFASDIEGIPSAIHTEKNGTLLPPKETTAWVNALTKYMQHPVSHEPSSKDTRAYTKEIFSWNHIKTQYETVFGVLTK